jgi:hypothetical protein
MEQGDGGNYILMTHLCSYAVEAMRMIEAVNVKIHAEDDFVIADALPSC